MRATMLFLIAGLAFPSGGTRADDLPNSWEFVGQTHAAATAKLRARVTGYVTRVAAKAGDVVAKGDLLVELAPRPYRLALEAALAQVQVAEAQLNAARIKTANTKKLHESNVISSEEVALRMADEAEAQAALVLAKVEAQRAELTLSWARITAPFDGRVSRVQITEGDIAIADQTQLLTVVSTDALHVCFNVDEARLLQLRRNGMSDMAELGVAVGFANEEGHPHEAKMDMIESVVDPATGTVQFRAAVSNPEGLFLPGMSARVRLTPPRK